MNASKIALSLMLGAASLLPSMASAGETLAPPAKVRTLCANCHGADGVAVLPGAANLSGQQQEYLRTQLRAFRSGRRQDPVMSTVAKTLTDDEIEEVTNWYSAVKVTVAMPQ